MSLSINLSVEQINKRLTAIAAIMSAKGFERPSAQFWIKDDNRNTIYMTAVENVPNFYGEGIEPLLAAEDWAANLPTLEQRRLNEFHEALSKASKLGVLAGVDDSQLLQLDAMIKKLAGNALAAPIESSAHLDDLLDNDNIPS